MHREEIHSLTKLIVQFGRQNNLRHTHATANSAIHITAMKRRREGQHRAMGKAHFVFGGSRKASLRK